MRYMQLYKRHLAGNVHGAGTTPENNASQLRISVAMATYNGEKYIEEQLLSICRQTRKPDEIVISDDGSRDATLEVVARVAASEDAQGIDFVVITDNPRHGCGGNFEWALKHTSGDVVFICGQDDIWLSDKVACIEQVFVEHCDALCVLHDAKIIDGTGELKELPFLTQADADIFTEKCNEGECFKLPHEVLEQSVSRPIISGIAISLRRSLLNQLSPFPIYAEDQWIEFNALLNNGCYFVNKILTYYRKHSSNTSGSRTKGIRKLKRLLQNLQVLKKRKALYLYTYEFGKGCKERLDAYKMQDDPAYGTAKRVYEIGLRKYNAYQKGGIMGAWMVWRMYRTDMRYRRCGFWAFFYDLLFVMTRTN